MTPSLPGVDEKVLVGPGTYLVYADVAGSQAGGGNDSIVVGCVVTPKRRADRLDREWLQIFAEHGVTSLHMEQFAGGRGEFAEWKDDKKRREAFLVALARSAQRHVRTLIITVLDKPSFEAVDRSFALSERFRGKYAAAIIFTMAIAIPWLKENAPNAGVVIGLEEGDAGQKEFLHYSEELLGFRPALMGKRHPETREALTPMQLADFVAYEFRLAYERRIKNKTQHPSRIGLRHLDAVPKRAYILGASTLIKICESMKLKRRDGRVA